MKSTNPVVANALNSVKANNAKFKVGDLVLEPTGGSKPTKIIRVFNLPQDEKKLAREFGGDWEEVRADYMRGKTWYNIERDGNGAFYTDLDLKKVTNAAVATNKGIDNPAELRAAADLARALADAKTKVGAVLGKFNSTKFADIKWAQSVHKKCDAVAAAINEARTAIQKGADVS